MNVIGRIAIALVTSCGAVLLAPGTYPIDGVLNINASGVVLRGSGAQQTIIYGATNTNTTERTLINVNGSNSQSTSNTQNILDKYVPVGSISFTVANASGFAVGDTVKRGQVIARMGGTGRATGPNLHFEVLVNDRPVDPLTYVGQTH